MTKLGTFRIAALLATLVAVLTPIQASRADIFQWEYVNPTNPVSGKQERASLTPDGAGAVAAPGANLTNRNLTKAFLAGASLSPSVGYDESGYIASYTRTNLTNATLSEADLSYAGFNAATMTGANLNGAEVRWANFDRYDQYGFSDAYGYGTGISFAQLASTASFAAHDLTGISLGKHNLTGANFTGFNLTDARFAGANLTNANFSNANLTGGVISGTLAGMNLSNAEVRGASLWDVTKAQLYSTASYQSGDLRGIYLYSPQTNWNFSGKNLSQSQFQSSMNFAGSNFSDANLTGGYLSYISFQNANLSQANLVDANFVLSKLSGANLAGADVRGANFMRNVNTSVGGLSPAQLTSTASYAADDLSGVKLRYNVLTGVDFQGKTLTNVDLVGATLDGANFNGADVRGALLERDVSRGVGGITIAQLQSTASYATCDLQEIGLGGNNLAGINLAGQNLSNATFDSGEGYGSNLTGANFTGANLTNARVGYTNFAGATFVQANLTGVNLQHATLANVNLFQAILARSDMGGYVIVVQGGEEGGGGYYNFPGANPAGVNLAGADLTRANFSGSYDQFGSPSPGANLTDANLSGADSRGANFQFATLAGANTMNLIQTNGHVDGLSLHAGSALVVRDLDVDYGAGVPIVVEQHMTMGTEGALRMEFDADPWGSTISFAGGIPVDRGGVLELAFAAGVDIGSQLGRTIDLFNWSGVSPTGQFTILSPFHWDLSKLYTTGEVTLAGIGSGWAADFNGDSLVDGFDLANWQSSFGVAGAAMHDQGDADGDFDVDGADFLAWQRQLGSGLPAVGASATVPEPATVALFGVAAVFIHWIGRAMCQGLVSA